MLVHVLVAVVPLATSNFTLLGIGGNSLTWDRFDLVKVTLLRGVVLLALAAWAWGTTAVGERIRYTRFLWLPAVATGWAALSTAFAVHRPTAVLGAYGRHEGLLTYVTYALLLFLAVQLLDSPDRIRSLARTMVCAGAVVAAYGLAQHLGFDPIRWGQMSFEQGRAFATYGNPDLLAGYLLFPLLAAPVLALTEERAVVRAGWWTAFAVIGAGTFVTFARGAWVASAVGMTALAVAVLRQRSVARRGDAAAVAGSAALLAALVTRSLLSATASTNVSERLRSLATSEGSVGQRLALWSDALRGLSARPLTGYGPDSFQLAFHRFRGDRLARLAGATGTVDNAHDWPLQLAITVGLPGAALVLAVPIVALVMSARHAFKRDGGPGRLVLAGFWAAVLAFLGYSLYGIATPGAAMFVWLSAGILIAPRASSRLLSLPSWRKAAAIAVTALCVAGALAGIVPLMGDAAFRNGIVDPSATARLTDFRRAIALNPVNGAYRARLVGDLTAEMEAARAPGGTGLPASAAFFRQAERAAREAVAYNPADYEARVALAHLYDRAAVSVGPRWVDGASAAKEAIALSPAGATAHYELAVALLGGGDAVGAAVEASRATDLDPQYVDAIVLLGDAYLATRRPVEASAAFRRALTLAPGDAAASAGLRHAQSEFPTRSVGTP